jgi:NAD(P)-dependent dehydrogenase (short-subunit alcohol dehydrogenase family)
MVASLGSWWQKGKVVDQGPVEYEAVRAASLDAQVHAAMAFLPLLQQRPESTYTLITGAGGQMSIPGTGLLVVAVSGVFGLSRMLRQEHAPTTVCVNEVMIRTRIERAARQGVVPASDFGAAVVDLLAGDVRSAVLHFDGGSAMTPAAPT